MAWFWRRKQETETPEQVAWIRRRSEMWSASHFLTGDIIRNWDVWDTDKRREVLRIHDADRVIFEEPPPEPATERMRFASLINRSEVSFRHIVILRLVNEGVGVRHQLLEEWQSDLLHNDWLADQSDEVRDAWESYRRKMKS